MTISTKKVVAAVVGLGLALSIFAGVGALSANAQAMTASQLVDLFISLGIISRDKAEAAKAAVTSSASVSFTKDLTVGSSGAEVTALQNALGVSPATGYFGSVTKAAVQKYQASKGIAATGYVGPLTRAALNGSASTGSTSTSGSVSTPVVNSGVEGTLTASKTSISNSTVREGETMKNILAFKLEAKLSDINVQRVKLDLGTSTTIYTKIFKTVYITDDAGKVLAQADLNSNTVVKDDTQYALTLGGFSYTVPRNSTKTLYVKADVYSSIKEADQYTRTVRLFGSNGTAVRGVDGAGLDQYTGSNTITQNLSVGETVAETATVKLTLNSANFKAADVVAASGADENEADMVSVLAFDLKAEKDSMLVTELSATIAKTGTGAATSTRAHLYEGSTPIASEDVNTSTGVVTFDDLDLTIPKDSMRTFTIKVDIIDANATAAVMTASVTGGNIVAENSLGTEKTVTGSATGEAFTVRNVGPVYALQSKSISTSGQNQSGSTLATSTVQARFVVNVTAVGGDILFGTQASTTRPMFTFKTYNSAGTDTTANFAWANASTTGFTVPDGVTTSTDSFSLTEGQTKTITVTVDLAGKTAAGAPIPATAVAIDSIQWVANGAGQVSNFMSGKTDWRTNTQNP